MCARILVAGVCLPHATFSSKGDKFHDIMWMEVAEGIPSMCSLCGQIFKLETDHSQYAH
jgi:hypothetical protein